MKNFYRVPFELHGFKLNLTSAIILAVLANMQGTNKEAWPKQDTLADLLGVSKSSVRRAVAELCKENLIEVVCVGYGRPNHYKLTSKAVDIFNGNGVQIEQSRMFKLNTSGVQIEHPMCPKRTIMNVQIEQSEQEPLNKNQIKELLTRQSEKIFVFSDEPEGVDNLPAEIQRAMRYCISCSEMAGMDAEEQWRAGGSKWLEISRKKWTDREDDNVDYFLKKVKDGYKAKSLAHIIRARILTD